MGSILHFDKGEIFFFYNGATLPLDDLLESEFSVAESIQAGTIGMGTFPMV